MELEGTLIEKIILNDQVINLDKLRDVYFRNLGSTSVSVGENVLRPYEDTPTFSSSTTLSSKEITITFNNKASSINKLYMRAIKVTGCICRE